MSDENPSLALLLSSRAKVLHQTRRPYIEKRVVELDDKCYVLHRFPSRASLVEFEQTLRNARAEGAALQEVTLSTSTQDDAPGFWLILNCVPGELMAGRRFDSGMLASLAASVASLHRVKASHAHPLLQRDMDLVPFDDFLNTHDLSLAERRWVAASAERFYCIDRFQLSHGDLHGRNIIAGSDMQVALIDYELLAFEPAGLELATVLLRSYCRSSLNRRIFLKAYRAKTTKADFSFWMAHATDLLFAASLRLAWQRQRRSLILRRRYSLLVCLRLLAVFSAPKRKQLEARIDELEVQLEQSLKGAAIYGALSRQLLHAAIESPGLSADALVTLAYAALRRDYAVYVGR